MQRIARCYLAFDRRKGSNPFLESGNEPTNQPANQPTNPSVSFSIPISSFEKVRYTAFENLLRLPSGATLVGSMVHWPRSRSYFLPSFSPFPFFFFFFLPSPLRFEKVSCIGRKEEKKRKKKVGGIHIQIVTSRMYPLHGSSVKTQLPGSSVGRSNGRGSWARERRIFRLVEHLPLGVERIPTFYVLKEDNKRRVRKFGSRNVDLRVQVLKRRIHHPVP